MQTGEWRWGLADILNRSFQADKTPKVNVKTLILHYVLASGYAFQLIWTISTFVLICSNFFEIRASRDQYAGPKVTSGFGCFSARLMATVIVQVINVTFNLKHSHTCAGFEGKWLTYWKEVWWVKKRERSDDHTGRKQTSGLRGGAGRGCGCVAQWHHLVREKQRDTGSQRDTTLPL